MYTCVWLMGCWSYTGSYAVQRFYTVSDVSLKATMSGLMFLYWNTEAGEGRGQRRRIKKYGTFDLGIA